MDSLEWCHNLTQTLAAFGQTGCIHPEFDFDVLVSFRESNSQRLRFLRPCVFDWLILDDFDWLKHEIFSFSTPVPFGVWGSRI
jgi:hypothetical protein